MADEYKPDPTSLTTQALATSIQSLRELIETRLDAYDKAITLLQDATNKAPSIAEIVAKYDEKFVGVDAQFSASKSAVDAALIANKSAVDAAFAAAKEAVKEQQISNSAANEKTELGFTKQIDQIGNIINSQAKSLDDKIDDIKQRLSITENRTTTPANVTTNGNNNSNFTLPAIILAVAMIVVGFFVFQSQPNYQNSPVTTPTEQVR